MPKYLSSQSYHTLKHWQSNKHSAVFTSYLKKYTGFIIDGAIDEDGDLCIFPWSWHESDAIAGDTWNDGSGLSDQAWYIEPALSLVRAIKCTTPDDAYDLYFILYKAGVVEMVPSTVPYTADGNLTANYQILTHSNGILIGSFNPSSEQTHTFEFGADYTGKVLIPTVARYKCYWNFYEHGTTPASRYSICEDLGYCSSLLSYHNKWDWNTTRVLSSLISEVYDPDILSQVPRLTGLNLINWMDRNVTFRWGCVQGGCNANDDDGIMYRAGLGTTIPVESARMPCIITGQSSGSVTANVGAYTFQEDETSVQAGSADPTGSCVLAGDMGRNLGQSVYYPAPVAYNNGYWKFGYAGNADDGISTIVRRITDISIKSNFRFFS